MVKTFNGYLSGSTYAQLWSPCLHLSIMDIVASIHCWLGAILFSMGCTADREALQNE